MDNLDVSVVICTYNRSELLVPALESVVAQNASDVRYELIVVDNNSTDETRQVVESFIANRSNDGGDTSSGDSSSRDNAASVRYVFEGKQGLSHARNAGIENARAPIVAFTDDDVRVAPDWVQSIKRSLDEHPEIDYVGGKVFPRWEREPSPWLTPEHWSPLALQDHGDAPFYVNVNRQICLVGANLSFRRTVFDQVGVFPPDLQRVKNGIGSMEDHDFSMRCWRAGKQGMYVPDIVVTADVQAERVGKDYHRRWHTGHGKFSSLMRMEELVVRNGQIVDRYEEEATLFKTPGYIYRQLLRESGSWLSAALRRQESTAFVYENKVRYYLGYISKRYEQHVAQHKERSHLAEVAAFAQTLIRKKKKRGASGGHSKQAL